jgi:hypothetical protein
VCFTLVLLRTELYLIKAGHSSIRYTILKNSLDLIHSIRYVSIVLRRNTPQSLSLVRIGCVCVFTRAHKEEETYEHNFCGMHSAGVSEVAHVDGMTKLACCHDAI